jgi:hypothetical protein
VPEAELREHFAGLSLVCLEERQASFPRTIAAVEKCFAVRF